MTLPEPRYQKPVWGFTLIELLVVMSIVALLISILLPALASARHSARTSICLSNLKQIGIAAEIYHNDFNDFAMPAEPRYPGQPTSGSGSTNVWQNFAYVRYMNKNQAVFQCSELSQDQLFNPTGGGNGDYGKLKKASYVMNAIQASRWAGADISPYSTSKSSGWTNGTGWVAIRLFEVYAPSEVLYIVDSEPNISAADARSIGKFKETNFGNFASPTDDRDVGYQHGSRQIDSGTFNALMGDSSCRAFKTQNVQHIQWVAQRVQ